MSKYSLHIKLLLHTITSVNSRVFVRATTSQPINVTNAHVCRRVDVMKNDADKHLEHPLI